MAGGAGRGGGSFLPSLENTCSGAAGKALFLVPFVPLFLTFGLFLFHSKSLQWWVLKTQSLQKHHQKLPR